MIQAVLSIISAYILPIYILSDSMQQHSDREGREYHEGSGKWEVYLYKSDFLIPT
jgi:hypothetical protein